MTSMNIRIGLSALLAGAAISMSLAQPAQAKDVDKSSPKLAEFVAKGDEVSSKISSISGQLNELKALCDELSALAGEADTELSASSEAAAAQAEEATQASVIFGEQIAHLLDPETVSLVSSKLKLMMDQNNDGTIHANDPILDSVQPVMTELETLLATLETLKQLAKEAKNNGEGRKEYVGHVSIMKL